MAVKQKKRNHRPSLLVDSLNRFFTFIYSVFAHSRIGRALSSDDTLCKRSFLASVFYKRLERNGDSSGKRRARLLNRSRVAGLVLFIRSFLLSLSLNVYGIFFVSYGIFRIVSYYITSVFNEFAVTDRFTLIGASVIFICAVPLLFSSQSVAQAFSNSRIMSRIIVDFLCIPNEKLKVQRQYGGTIYIFVSAVLALLLGFATYSLHPLYLPCVFAALILLFVIFSNPESGIILTLAALPFMQFLDHSNELLLVLILTVGISYFCKIIKKRRTLSFSPESAMILILCGFIFVCGIFSAGGGKTLSESLTAIAVILGGFLLTYNLMQSEKLLRISLKTLAVSFIIISLVGISDSFFNGISDRISDTFVGRNILSITQPDILLMADRGVVFGMFAILIFPLLLSYITKQNTVQRVCASIVLVIIAVVSAWMCSHYEIIIALSIEFILFWILYSHRSLTYILLFLMPIVILTLLYPYAVENWYWPDIKSVLMEYMPANVVDSGMHHEVSDSVIDMLIDNKLVGIGAGTYAFESVYPAYSTVSSSNADHPMSMWLQILCWSGIFGLVAFLIFVGFMMKRSLGYFIDPYKKTGKSSALALFCGIIGLLLFGLVYSVWSNLRILYLFWTCVGLLMSYIGSGSDRAKLENSSFSSKNDASEIELIFH